MTGRAEPPDGRERDARVASDLASGRCESAEVRGWIASFNRKALAFCGRWRHTPEDVDDLVQGFWRYAFQARLFAGYSPDRGTLDGYLLVCLRHEFFRHGRRLADRRAREEPVADDALVRPGRSVLDTLETDEALRRMERCLATLGMAVGEAGWLIQQVHLKERSYASLAEQLFPSEPLENRRQQENRLRKRQFDALAKLRRCLEAADGRSSGPRTGDGRSTPPGQHPGGVEGRE